MSSMARFKALTLFSSFRLAFLGYISPSCFPIFLGLTGSVSHGPFSASPRFQDIYIYIYVFDVRSE